MPVLDVPVVTLLVLALAAMPAPAPDPGGSVEGTVVDNRTHRPLAAVRVQHLPSGATVTTGGDGRFRLTGLPAGPGTLVFSVVGYGLARRQLDVPTATGAALTVPLTEGTGTYSEEVTVAEDVFASREGATTERVIGNAALRDLRGVVTDDPVRALQVVPGVSSADDFHSVFQVRGLPLRNTGFVLDGIPSPFLVHSTREVEGGGSVTAVGGDILATATLLAGAYPQRYGGRTGAQLEFTTRDGSLDDTQVRLALSGSSGSVTAEGPLGRGRNASWLLAGRKSYTELLFKEIFDDDTFAFGFADAFLKLAWSASPRHHLQLGVLGGRSRFDEQAESIGPNEARDSVQRLGLGYLGWRLTSGSLLLHQRVYAVGARFTNHADDGAVLDEGRDVERGWRADATWSVRPSLGVQAGGQLSERSASHDAHRHEPDDGPLVVRESFDGTAATVGAYLQARWSPRSTLTITPGVRGDRWGIIGRSVLSPWLQAEWRAGTVRILASGGVHLQPPDQVHVSGQRGSRDLRPEEAHHLDVTLEHRATESVRCQLTWFGRDEREGLRLPGSEPRRVGDVLVLPARDTTWANVLEGRARGAEVLLERRSTGRVPGWASYAYLRHRIIDRTTGERFWSDFDQRHTVNLYGNVRLTSRTSVGLKFRASSNAPITGYWEERRPTATGPAPLFAGFDPRFGDFVGERRNELRLPAYARLDLRAAHAFQRRRTRTTVFVEVVNATNHDNQRIASPSVDGRTGRAANLTEALFPIVPSAGVLVEF